MPSYSGVWTLPAQYQAKGSTNWPMGPGAPTSVSATAGDASATVTFVAPAFTGIPAGITGYLATSSPGGFTATGASSPLTVTGLTNGTSYTISVQATNSVGYGPAGTSGSVTPVLPAQRLLTAGGSIPTPSPYATSVISYVDITTTGNATFFGSLSVVKLGMGSCASSTRGIFAAGYSDAGGGTYYSAIEYVTIATTGNTTSFGNYSLSTYNVSGCNSSTRGVFFGNNASNTSGMYYITIASTGNSTSFGGLTSGAYAAAGAFSSSTRGVWAGGLGSGGAGGTVNVMSYVTIASASNSTTFGTLSGYNAYSAGASNSTRGLIFGGSYNGNDTNAIQYVTIATTGNTTSFGSLSSAVFQLAAGAGATRAIQSGGRVGGNESSAMNYVTIASTGNSVSFGNLTVAVYSNTALSSYNGGVQ